MTDENAEQGAAEESSVQYVRMTWVAMDDLVELRCHLHWLDGCLHAAYSNLPVSVGAGLLHHISEAIAILEGTDEQEPKDGTKHTNSSGGPG